MNRCSSGNDKQLGDANIDDFVAYEDAKIKWSRNLKRELKRGRIAEYAESKVRNSLYRPFTKSYLFFDRIMNDEISSFASIFPTPKAEAENRVIIVSDHGFRADFSTLMANLIPDLHTLAASDGFQCFPFYTYDEDGTNRRENITDWALTQFRGAPLPRRDHRQVGHLPLYLRPPTSPRLSRAVSGEPQARFTAPALYAQLLGLCQSRAAVRRNPYRL